MDINYEEFITILKEKDKYEKMKENVRNISEKLEKEKTENIRLNNLLKIIEHLHHYDDLY